MVTPQGRLCGRAIFFSFQSNASQDLDANSHGYRTQAENLQQLQRRAHLSVPPPVLSPQSSRLSPGTFGIIITNVCRISSQRFREAINTPGVTSILAGSLPDRLMQFIDMSNCEETAYGVRFQGGYLSLMISGSISAALLMNIHTLSCRNMNQKW